jgi:hypothetical protein
MHTSLFYRSPLTRRVNHATSSSTFACLLWIAFTSAGAQPASADSLPADAQPTCTVSTSASPPKSDIAEFKSWFHSKMITKGGAVDPANSVEFLDLPNNCIFYQWAERMFLYLTSTSAGHRLTFESAEFLDVSPEVDFKRTFIPHVEGESLRFQLRSAQPGPHGLPVMLDKSGTMFEIQPPQLAANGKQLVLNSSAQPVETEGVALQNGQPIFLDLNGKPIRGAKPVPQQQLKSMHLRQELDTANIVQKFMTGETPVFITLSGHMVEVEQGEASTTANPLHGVLETQPLHCAVHTNPMSTCGSLVYYATMVNDVFAYFATGQKNGAIAANQFPTTGGELVKIEDFAKKHGRKFAHPDALVMEVKSSWVEASQVPNPGNYITMTATVPTYDRSDLKEWKRQGDKTVELAMVGMHVVGSVKGHPEMIWATFEHSDNTPLEAYTYNSNSGTKTVPRSKSGPWLFCADDPAPPFNKPHMNMSEPDLLDIKAASPNSIGPSNTIRWKTWGAASDRTPNPLVADTAESNTQILSINNNVRGMMAAGDVRSHYIMTGATWTEGGGPPDTTPQVGTSQLTNTTMETYQQGASSKFLTSQNTLNGTNCFTCHSGPMLGDARDNIGLSHVFGRLQALSFSAPVSHPDPTQACLQRCQNAQKSCEDDCTKANNFCMTHPDNGGKLAPQCVGEAKECRGRCPNLVTECKAKCK